MAMQGEEKLQVAGLLQKSQDSQKLPGSRGETRFVRAISRHPVGFIIQEKNWAHWCEKPETPRRASVLACQLFAMIPGSHRCDWTGMVT